MIIIAHIIYYAINRYDKSIFYCYNIFFFAIIFGTNNASAQSDKVSERLQANKLETATANMTDKMKYLCLEVGPERRIDEIEGKNNKHNVKGF